MLENWLIEVLGPHLFYIFKILLLFGGGLIVLFSSILIPLALAVTLDEYVHKGLKR